MTKNIVVLFFIICFSNLFAQTDSVTTEYYKFVLSDSSKFIGSIIFEDKNVVQIVTNTSAEFRFKKPNIVHQTLVLSNLENNDSTSMSNFIEKPPYKDPTNSKLFISPTAKNLEACSGMVGLYEFIIPYANLGITDRVSIGAFLIPLPFNSSVAYNGQVNVYSKKPYDIATGVFYFHSLKKSGEDNYFLYGVTTISSNTKMINVLSGYSPLTNNYFISIGGEIQISDEIKIVTDNWYLSSKADNIFFTLGLRFFEESYSFDLGAIAVKTKEIDYHNNQVKHEFKMAGIGVWIGFAIYF